MSTPTTPSAPATTATVTVRSPQEEWNAAVRAAAEKLYVATWVNNPAPGARPPFNTLNRAQQQVFITAAIVTVHRLNSVNHHLALSQGQRVAGGNPQAFAEALHAYFVALGLPIATLRSLTR